jgi:hypothetical protein
VIALEAEITIENENSEPANLSAGQNVLVVVCTAEEGGFVITKIITLERSATYRLHAAEEVLICHKPGRKAGLTLSVPESALIAHLAHGDTRGACP